MEKYPEDSDRRQGLARVAEMGISFVPVAGSALQVAFNEAAGRRLSDRRTRWFNALAEKVHRLEDRVGGFEQLTGQDVFMDAVTTASQIADRTSREAKLELLRNAVVNSVMPDAPDDDTQQLFFDMIDRFTPTHVRLLNLLSDPPAWFDRQGIARPRFYSASKTAIITAGMVELANRPDLVDRYAEALTTSGLVNQALNTMMTESGLWVSATTTLAGEFLRFVADPETELAG